jgi:hypothetical protein
MSDHTGLTLARIYRLVHLKFPLFLMFPLGNYPLTNSPLQLDYKFPLAYALFRVKLTLSPIAKSYCYYQYAYCDGPE